MTGPVTALGIREGDPAVLRALIARRGSAVLAYCERACAPPDVVAAAAEAFAGFRAVVVAAPRPAELDPEAALLSSTRHAAAERAPRGQAPASAAARAVEERLRTAEHAYRSSPPRAIPPDVVDRIVEAMSAVPATVASPPRISRAGGVPGKGALAPAAAVLAVAAVSILATSGVLGGNESQPPVDTGIAPERTQVEVPEGEASAVVDDLRRAADRARRRRLADRRGDAPVAPAPEATAPPAQLGEGGATAETP